MPAPKRANTTAATEAAAKAAVRRTQERKADELRTAGWTVVPPDEDHPLLRVVAAAVAWRRMRAATPVRPKAESAELVAAVDALESVRASDANR